MARQCIVGMCALLLLAAPWAADCSASSAPLTVFVSILPQKQMVQRIGHDRVDVQVMVPAGANPHAYEPRPAQMAALSKAQIYFSVGIAFENVWLPKFAAINRDMAVIATDDGIEKLPMTVDHHHDHGKHRHRPKNDPHQFDPHIWLSPALIRSMAATIRNALVAADPEHAALFDRQHATYLQEIDALDRRIRQRLEGAKGSRFMVFHPSWGYFAHQYGLVQVPIEIEGKEPKPAQLQKLIREARSSDIRVIFVQPQFSTRSAQMIADAIEAQTVTADPLSPDLLDHLLQLAEAIHAAGEKNP
jgi:zinc transport system substrate-binding protein